MIRMFTSAILIYIEALFVPMIRKETVSKLFEEFLKTHNEKRTNDIWKNQSDEFRRFWRTKIMDPRVTYSPEELKRIIQILDVKGDRSGAHSGLEGAAFVQIYQGDWQNIFRDIKSKGLIREKLDTILNSEDDDVVIQTINDLEEINSIKKLTGLYAVVLNDFLFVYKPDKYTSVMSLYDRYLILDYFGLGDSTRLQGMSYGERIVESNKLILTLDRKYSLDASARTQAEFLYSEPVKKLWRRGDTFSDEIVGVIAHVNFGDKSGIYSDRYLEEFESGGRDHWNTPSNYMGDEPGIILLYDPDRKGITIQAEVTEINSHGSGDYPVRNVLNKESIVIFDPPISRETVRSVKGLESFGKSQTPKYNLKRRMYEDLMNKYEGRLKSTLRFDGSSKPYTLRKDKDRIEIIGDGIDPKTKRTMVETRLFQSEFRNSILEFFRHKCLFCDIDSDILLEASHIKPVSEDINSAGIYANGLALCRIHHKLFDMGLVSLKDGKITPSSKLVSMESEFLNEQFNELIRKPAIRMPKGDESELYLIWHFKHVFRNS